MTISPAEFFDHDGVTIAYRRRLGANPGVVWLGGFRSDMSGTKADALDNWAMETGHAFLRHDYSGHGLSGGAFRDGYISKWLDESLDAFQRFTSGSQILVGSSMGAWIALRMVAELRRQGDTRVAGLVLLAPAPDFTTELMEPQLSDGQRGDLDRLGYFEIPSAYSPEPNVYTRRLFDDGRANRVLNGPINTHCPVHILQGLADPDVPHTHALKLAACLPSDDVTLSLIPGGDHRLSRPEDLQLLVSVVATMVDRVGKS